MQIVCIKCTRFSNSILDDLVSWTRIACQGAFLAGIRNFNISQFSINPQNFQLCNKCRNLVSSQVTRWLGQEIQLDEFSKKSSLDLFVAKSQGWQRPWLLPEGQSASAPESSSWLDLPWSAEPQGCSWRSFAPGETSSSQFEISTLLHTPTMINGRNS